jgi:hypothetical protein
VSNTDVEPKRGRIAQIRDVYRQTKKTKPLIGLILLGYFFGVLIVFILLGFLFKSPFVFGLLGVFSGIAVMAFIFGRVGEAEMYKQIEGQPGAAASALSTLRAGWFVTPAVSVTKHQDLVHRVLGRPGIILVAEAPASRATSLLANERRRTARFAADVPIHEFVIGNEEGQVPLRKIQRRVMRLPRVLRPAEVTALRKRLDALTTTPLPIPKGPMPKNGRVPRSPRG